MNSFVSKPIISTQTIGERLRKAREGAGLQLPDVSRTLAIKCEYLEAIESGSHGELPGEIYALEFTKRYAAALRMDPAKAADAFRAERRVEPGGQSWRMFHLQPLARSKARLLARTFAFAACAGALLYAALFGGALLGPPELSIAGPTRYHEARNFRVMVHGTAPGADKVSVNGESLPLRRDGSFAEPLNLAPGYHVLRITAQGRGGRESTEYRAVRVRDTAADSLVLQTAD